MELNKENFNIVERVIIKIFKKTFVKFYNYIRVEIVNRFVDWK